MKLIWVNCFLPLDYCYLLATANVAALFLRWSVFPYVLTETAQFSTQHSVSKTKIAIREALHVSKQMYHFHVNILTHSCFTACGSATPRIVVIVHFRILTYFHLLTARATLQINCTRWYALPVRWRFDCTMPLYFMNSTAADCNIDLANGAQRKLCPFLAGSHSKSGPVRLKLTVHMPSFRWR